jgi:hypothetical protein
MLQDRKIFFTLFAVSAFVMKIIAEFVHEILGHGSFALLFGGEIASVYISVLWPYDFSSVKFNMPNDITSAQWTWIYAGGILICLSASFLTQAFLLLEKRIRRFYALTLFWFAFWTFVSSTGYLIIGGLSPFGDVLQLIALGVITQFLSLILGLIIFCMGFVSLSWILRTTLLEIFPTKKASLGVTTFWLILPTLVLVMLANPDRTLQVICAPLAFIPVVFSFAVEYFLVLSKEKANKDPDNVA